MEQKHMLLEETYDKSVLEGQNKCYQPKINGERAFVHVKNHKVVGIRNRSNAPVLYRFPELREIEFLFHTGILDCEIAIFKNGKSIFYGGIDQRRSEPSQKTLKELPVTIVVFDALKIDDEVLMNKPYKYRLEKIKSIIQENDKIKVIESFENGKELWNRVVEQDLEGVVIKSLSGIYQMDKRVDLKMKNYKFTDVIVEKTEPNSKGVKIFGKTTINGKTIEVECQIPLMTDIEIGSVQTIKYLEFIGEKISQPTIAKRGQR